MSVFTVLTTAAWFSLNYIVNPLIEEMLLLVAFLASSLTLSYSPNPVRIIFLISRSD
jgi:hypothetical protein